MHQHDFHNNWDSCIHWRGNGAYHPTNIYSKSDKVAMLLVLVIQSHRVIMNSMEINSNNVYKTHEDFV